MTVGDGLDLHVSDDVIMLEAGPPPNPRLHRNFDLQISDSVIGQVRQ